MGFGGVSSAVSFHAVQGIPKLNDNPKRDDRINEDVPVSDRRHMWYQQDCCPAHFALQVRNFLDEEYPERWIGRSGRKPEGRCGRGPAGERHLDHVTSPTLGMRDSNNRSIFADYFMTVEGLVQRQYDKI
ncbi:hypothetical protein EVAR_39632_1 [Eumeta japonica]|uniref:Uncharacterized protein n=1 Tax=Eumeta variegata TaxID=151549 RepID=A0A4C1WIX4_EUMVA|nr:hypothetical protein EVAR_39632_1 [Eumeta japonica]